MVYIYLHLLDFMVNVGEYYMNPMGMVPFLHCFFCCLKPPDCCVSHPSTNHITTIHGAKVHLTSCSCISPVSTWNRLDRWVFSYEKHGYLKTQLAMLTGR